MGIIVDHKQALAIVHEFLGGLEFDERVEVSRYDGSLLIRREKTVDPEMIERVKNVFERYDDVFRKLAES